jgi:hypothetical protein
MTSQAAIRERYLRDDPAVRLGGLAANLARIRSFSANPEHQDAVLSLLEESAFFIEWTARDVELDLQLELAALQRTLIKWRAAWSDMHGVHSHRSEIAQQAGEWSQQILQMAGLLPASGK